MEQLYTCREVAALAKVKIGTVWEWIKDGKIEARTVFGHYRITESEVRRLLNGEGNVSR